MVPSEDQVVGEAQKLVSRRPDLILVWTGSVAAARAAKDATHTIPIVLMAVPDVVEHGLVDSLARPGGNITGISIPVYDLTIKQLQVLKEINPRLQRIVVVQGDLSAVTATWSTVFAGRPTRSGCRAAWPRPMCRT